MSCSNHVQIAGRASKNISIERCAAWELDSCSAAAPRASPPFVPDFDTQAHTNQSTFAFSHSNHSQCTPPSSPPSHSRPPSSLLLRLSRSARAPSLAAALYVPYTHLSINLCKGGNSHLFSTVLLLLPSRPGRKPGLRLLPVRPAGRQQRLPPPLQQLRGLRLPRLRSLAGVPAPQERPLHWW